MYVAATRVGPSDAICSHVLCAVCLLLSIRCRCCPALHALVHSATGRRCVVLVWRLSGDGSRSATQTQPARFEASTAAATPHSQHSR